MDDDSNGVTDDICYTLEEDDSKEKAKKVPTSVRMKNMRVRKIAKLRDAREAAKITAVVSE